MSSNLPGRVYVALQLVELSSYSLEDITIKSPTKRQSAIKEAAENVLLKYLLGEHDFSDEPKVNKDDNDSASGVVVKV